MLVTGAASGIGLAAAGFARLGASVCVLARDRDRAEQAARLTREHSAPAADVVPAVCDVADLAAVGAFAADFAAREERLDVLVNNAGVMPDGRQVTAEGVELCFATHVLAGTAACPGTPPLRRTGRCTDATTAPVPAGTACGFALFGPSRALGAGARGHGVDEAGRAGVRSSSCSRFGDLLAAVS